MRIFGRLKLLELNSPWGSPSDKIIQGMIGENNIFFLSRHGSGHKFSPSAINYQLSDGFGNLGKLKKYEKPLYIIHADKDHIVPFEEGKKMYDEANPIFKELFVVKGTNHNNIIMTLKDKYFKNIKAFIDRIN